MKALLVSTHDRSRELMKLVLQSAGRATGEPWEYLEAADGIEGLRLAWGRRPEVVVAEEYASRAGAFAMTRDLRGAIEPFDGVIVVLLDREADAWLADWSGADAWFVKPIDPFELADAIVDLLKGKAGTEELV